MIQYKLCILGLLPKRIFIGFVSLDSANADIHRNPFHFHHYDHNSIIVSSDIHSKILPIKSNFSKNFYLSAYLSLYSASNIFYSDSGFSISRNDYKNGNALCGFDLSEDFSASAAHLSLPRQGSLRIDLQFAKQLPEAVSMIIYAEFDSIIEIDRRRNIICDYSS